MIRNSPEGEHMIGHMELGVEYVHVRGVPTGMPTLEGIVVVPEMRVKPSVYNFAQKKIVCVCICERNNFPILC